MRENQLLVAGVVAMAMLVGCSGTGAPDGSGALTSRPPPGPTAATGLPTTSGAPVDSVPILPDTSRIAADDLDTPVAAAYLDAVRAEVTASQASDPTDGALLATHVDPLLARLVDRLRGRRILGQAAREPEGSPSDTKVISVRVDGATAEVTDCTVDAAIVYETATGRVINDKVVTQRRRATMRQDDGGWRAGERFIDYEGEGVTSCVVGS